MLQRYRNPVLLALLAATLLALVWNEFGMRSVLVVDADSNYPLSTFDDRREANGKSVASLRREGHELVLDCMANAGYEYPYCEMAIQLKAPPAGLDLSGYDTVRLWVRYEGPQTQQQVRFYVRNFDPAYSRIADEMSLKTHEVVFDPARSATPLEFGMSKFSVASWWISERNLPIEHAGVDFSHVSAIEVGTGNNVPVGRHRISVERIEFSGKLISKASFRLFVLAAWMVGIFGFVMAAGLATRRQLRESKRSQLSLQRINLALRLRTQDYAQRAAIDPLTGVLNRQGLGDKLHQLSKEGDQHLFPLSLVFIDIDYFKRINDQHGHAVGDSVLKELATLTASQIQRDDLLARWGGEEFLLLCPLTRSHDARIIAERLRAAIAANRWPAGLRVTSSFGIAESMAGEDLSEGIRRADEAMYQAKRNGRDRVEVHMLPAAGKAEEMVV